MKISKDDLATIGSDSLLGMLILAGEIPNPEKVVKLDFEQFNVQQVEHNNGPDYVLIPEYVIPCILRDVLHLVEKEGYTIQVGEYHSDQH